MALLRPEASLPRSTPLQQGGGHRSAFAFLHRITPTVMPTCHGSITSYLSFLLQPNSRKQVPTLTTSQFSPVIIFPDLFFKNISNLQKVITSAMIFTHSYRFPNHSHFATLAFSSLFSLPISPVQKLWYCLGAMSVCLQNPVQMSHPETDI